MALTSNMNDLLFFVGDDWPAIPFSITQADKDGVVTVLDVSNMFLVLTFLDDAGGTIFSVNSTGSSGSRIVTTGPDTDAVHGSVYAIIYRAQTSMLTDLVGTIAYDEPSKLVQAKLYRADSGNMIRLWEGFVPCRS